MSICAYCGGIGGFHKKWCSRPVEKDRGMAPVEECSIPELSEEDKQRQLQRKADQSDLINWILHYKNPADDTEKLRQIRLVME